MALLSSRARSSGYIVSVVVLFLASVGYLTGYASPFWFHFTYYYDGGRRLYYGGLWMYCDERIFHKANCTSYEGTPGDWFTALQMMETLGLIGLFVACVYAIIVNACNIAQSHNRYLGGLSTLSGLSGFIGCMIYVGGRHHDLGLRARDFGWAFILNLVASIVVMITAVIIYNISGADLQPTASTSGGAVMFSEAATAPEATVLPQGGAYPPPGQRYQPGAMYVVGPGYSYLHVSSGSAQ